jgi:hypothetical protein
MDTAIPNSVAGLRGRSGRFEARNRSARWGLWARKYWTAPVQAGAITTAIGSQNQSGVAQRSVEQSSAPLASQELVLELVLVLVLVQAASCNLTRAWPTSIPMTPLTVCWCGSSRAGIVAVKAGFVATSTNEGWISTSYPLEHNSSCQKSSKKALLCCTSSCDRSRPLMSACAPHGKWSNQVSKRSRIAQRDVQTYSSTQNCFHFAASGVPLYARALRIWAL